MKQIEKNISPLIDSLFPSFYQEEGENFVAFIRAYYEWLEQNFQVLTLEDDTGFVKGSRITQENVTGTIYSVIDQDILVKVDSNETFKCFNVCSELIPVTTTTNGEFYSTYILRGGSARRLGSIFLSRNLLDYRDIDETIDLFVVFFKEKYLKNIEFDTATNKRLLVKNALDLYRAKGTERAIDLFFRLIYAARPEVEYPADVLFQPSGAEWVKPTYIEISPNTVDRAITLVGKEITGVTSGAKAFVEKYVKLRVNNGYSHVLFVSNVKGNFVTRELLIDDQLYSDSPVIYGSLSELIIRSSSSGFEIGDIFPVTTSTGISGLARVTEIRNATGQIEFELEEEGYGFSRNSSPSGITSKTLVSNNIVTVSNVVSGNVIATMTVRNAGSGYSNGTVFDIASAYGQPAQGIVITNSSGEIEALEIARRGSGFDTNFSTLVGIPGGTLGAVDYTTRHPESYYDIFDVVQQSDGSTVNAEGQLIGIPQTATLTVSNPAGAFSVGSTIRQVDNNIGEVASGVITGLNLTIGGGTIEIDQLKGRFRSGQTLSVVGSNASATFNSISFQLPVFVTSGQFQSNSDLIIASQVAGFFANTENVSTGTGASFNIFELNSDRETVYVNTDELSNTDILALPLDANEFNLPQSPSSNVDSIVFGTLQYQPLEIGEIKTISGLNPGSNYTQDPTVFIYQPYVGNFDYRNLSIKIDNSNTSFLTNEIVLQQYNESVFRITVDTTAGLRINEGIALQDGGESVAFGTVKSISNSTVFTMNDIEGSIQTGYTVVSTSNLAFSATVSSFRSLLENITVKGRLISQNNNEIFVKRMNFNNDFRTGVQLRGDNSGARGNVTSIDEITSSLAMGNNADVTAEAITADGEILSTQIIDSGFGYLNNQEGVTFLEDGKRASYTILVGGLGTGSGSYRSLKGFLSDLSKLHDGDFYQEYSYNIVSKISFERYAEMFKKTLHTSGTKFFGSVLLSSIINDTQVDVVANTYIEVSDTSPFTIFAPELDAAPAPWPIEDANVDGNVRLIDEPVADRANVHIEIRN